ncbi:MAG: hypothetical protein R3B81_19105 [bacterium]
MQRLLMASALVTVLALPAVGVAGAPETFADAKALAASQGKPVLVDFFATW